MRRRVDNKLRRAVRAWLLRGDYTGVAKHFPGDEAFVIIFLREAERGMWHGFSARVRETCAMYGVPYSGKARTLISAALWALSRKGDAAGRRARTILQPDKVAHPSEG